MCSCLHETFSCLTFSPSSFNLLAEDQSHLSPWIRQKAFSLWARNSFLYGPFILCTTNTECTIKCIAFLLPSALYKKRAKLVPYQRCALCIWISPCTAWAIIRNVCLGNAKKLTKSGIASTAGSEMWDFSRHLMALHQALNSPALPN